MWCFEFEIFMHDEITQFSFVEHHSLFYTGFFRRNAFAIDARERNQTECVKSFFFIYSVVWYGCIAFRF